MFISDEIVFVELQKTGCSHIRVLLSKFLQGDLIGKHNRPDHDLLKSKRTFLGSVRNPWDWYVSLWSYGCQPKGALYNQVTQPNARQFPSLQGRYWRHSPVNGILSVLYEGIRDPSPWQQCYSDVNNPECFRAWLRLLYGHRSCLDIQERYFYSFTKYTAGLLTYRYLYLFCRHHNDLYVDRALRHFDALKHFADKNCYIDYFIRNEHLESDLIDTLDHCSLSLNEAQQAQILSVSKTNASKRKRDFSYYYDSETVELVHQREKLIIDQFAYQPPVLTA